MKIFMLKSRLILALTSVSSLSTVFLHHPTIAIANHESGNFSTVDMFYEVTHKAERIIGQIILLAKEGKHEHYAAVADMDLSSSKQFYATSVTRSLSQENDAGEKAFSSYVQEIFPILEKIVDHFKSYLGRPNDGMKFVIEGIKIIKFKEVRDLVQKYKNPLLRIAQNNGDAELELYILNVVRLIEDSYQEWTAMSSLKIQNNVKKGMKK